MSLDLLAVYSMKCMKCAHFVEGAAKTYDSCHHSKGNKDCPAAEVQIVVTGKASRLAKAIRAAQQARNTERTQYLWAQVAKESESFQARVYQQLGLK